MFCVQPICAKDIYTGLQETFLELSWPKLGKKKKRAVEEHSAAFLRLIRAWPLTKDNPQLCTILWNAEQSISHYCLKDWDSITDLYA